MSTFPSKRDAWIVALIWAGALGVVVGGIAQLASTGPAALRAMALLLSLAAAAFMLWVLHGTGYIVGERQLFVRCGPFRYRVPLSQIDSVTPSRSPLASPACSLDRLQIEWSSGRRRILISPKPKAAFLQALSQRCPHLEPENGSLIRRGTG